jgi:hypothetical protein
MLYLKSQGTIKRIYPFNFLFNALENNEETFDAKCIDFSSVRQG